MRLFKDGAIGLRDFAFRLCFSVQVSSGALRSLPMGGEDHTYLDIRTMFRLLLRIMLFNFQKFF